MTITLKNFSVYVPEYKAFEAIYLQSEDGLDWYYHRTRFNSDTLKICFDCKNIVRSFSYDVQILWPDGLSVTEIAREKVPEGLDINGNWYFIDGKIVSRETIENSSPELIGKKRERLIKDAMQSIAVIQLKQINGRALTDAEKEKLEATLDYIKALETINPDAAPNIVWPDAPTE